jgi:hypothetical protein
LDLANLEMKETEMSDQDTEKRVPFVTVVWPDDYKGDAEDGTAQFEFLGSKQASDNSAFRDFWYDEFAEGLLDYQMQAVWDEIAAAESGKHGAPIRRPGT